MHLMAKHVYAHIGIGITNYNWNICHQTPMNRVFVVRFWVKCERNNWYICDKWHVVFPFKLLILNNNNEFKSRRKIPDNASAESSHPMSRAVYDWNKFTHIFHFRDWLTRVIIHRTGSHFWWWKSDFLVHTNKHQKLKLMLLMVSESERTRRHQHFPNVFRVKRFV